MAIVAASHLVDLVGEALVALVALQGVRAHNGWVVLHAKTHHGVGMCVLINLQDQLILSEDSSLLVAPLHAVTRLLNYADTCRTWVTAQRSGWQPVLDQRRQHGFHEVLEASRCLTCRFWATASRSCWQSMPCCSSSSFCGLVPDSFCGALFEDVKSPAGSAPQPANPAGSRCRAAPAPPAARCPTASGSAASAPRPLTAPPHHRPARSLQEMTRCMVNCGALCRTAS